MSIRPYRGIWFVSCLSLLYLFVFLILNRNKTSLFTERSTPHRNLETSVLNAGHKHQDNIQPIHMLREQIHKMHQKRKHYVSYEEMHKLEEPKPEGSEVNEYWGRCDEVGSTLSCTPGEPCEYENEVDFRVVVLTYMRPESLRTVLDHVDKMEMDGDKLAVEIWLDCSVGDVYHKSTYSVAQEYASTRPHVRVNVWKRHVGLLGQWVHTWRPKINTSELALLLEDDIDVSPFVYRYVNVFYDLENINRFANIS